MTWVRRLRLKVFLPLTGVLLLLFATMQNCANVNLASINDPVIAINAVPNLFNSLQPVLAVRNTGCIMCHAQVNGDLITDFGNGDPFVMGTDAISNHPNQVGYYGPFASKHFIFQGSGWQNSSIMGNVYVPDQQITNQALINAYVADTSNPTFNGTLSMLNFLQGGYVDTVYAPGVSSRVISTTNSSDITKPGLRGNFQTRETIWIDSPSSDEIRSLAQNTGAVQVVANLGVIVTKASADTQVSGLNPSQSAKTFKLIVTNTGNVVCMGDVIIDGALFLNNLNLLTDAKAAAST